MKYSVLAKTCDKICDLNGFTIKREYLEKRRFYKVSITPGTLLFKGIRNKESAQITSDITDANYHYEQYRKYAQQNIV